MLQTLRLERYDIVNSDLSIWNCIVSWSCPVLRTAFKLSMKADYTSSNESYWSLCQHWQHAMLVAGLLRTGPRASLLLWRKKADTLPMISAFTIVVCLWLWSRITHCPEFACQQQDEINTLLPIQPKSGLNQHGSLRQLLCPPLVLGLSPTCWGWILLI